MFWLGLLVGIIIGCIITIFLTRKLMMYIGEHPEIIEDIVDKATRQFTDTVVDELRKKLDNIKKPAYKSYEHNPFMSNAIDTTVQAEVTGNMFHEI